MNRAELIRVEILQQLYGFRPTARDAERIARFCRHDGDVADARPNEIEVEAAYLTDKGLIECVPDEVARGHRRWKIAAAGIDYLEQQGLT